MVDTETGRIREVVYAGMVTRYLVDLDGGGELQVVRQNLETSSGDALDARGGAVLLEWRPEHQLEIDTEPGETEGERMSKASQERVLGWSAMALLVGALAFTAAGCGGGGSKSVLDVDGSSRPGRRSGSIQAKAKHEGQVDLVTGPGYTAVAG